MKLFGVCAIVAGAACYHAGSVRDETNVLVDGKREAWRLEWHSPTKAVCANPDESLTCPCSGFENGRAGVVDLVREAGDRVDRLPLAPLFHGEETPAGDGVAVIAKPASILTMADFDHDGRPTEFMLQVGTLPCGHREAVIVGVSRSAATLHAFASVGHPTRPLVLEVQTWRALLASPGGHATRVELTCGDHASEKEIEVEVLATPAGFDGTRRTFACYDRAARGRLISSERL